MILVIDNYDSFTFNLVQYFGELGEDLEVSRNDEITLLDIENKNPNYIVISPGPCTPDEAGISLEVIKHFSGRIPILGVCLGHQAIAQAFGGKVVRAEKLMHGKTSIIYHDQKTIFKNIPQAFKATRYHSLIVDDKSLSPEFEVSAKTNAGEIMAIRHKEYPLEGVQFHPESILTEYGKELIKNFISHYARVPYEMDIK
ncbi:anthranilate/aminodeoxychorismate synthase component II [Vulcanibacillus modesticaldus]|uniref:Anthranilate/aminodeoxychorismate synthase component II n=1 Tax=Vulcanibacillus modesticaldus TaxID=337097 RepID=A0A1D2YXH5_9BACI|nr:aminodeoxychorismate/anthranilate synthase component II [Vulcanibacillus modesticaldus]OEG00317.1 anthranilate/aminodeoxychorismate synthase component II [Vulcanibacillus modesticaldus]